MSTAYEMCGNNCVNAFVESSLVTEKIVPSKEDIPNSNEPKTEVFNFIEMFYTPNWLLFYTVSGREPT